MKMKIHHVKLVKEVNDLGIKRSVATACLNRMQNLNDLRGQLIETVNTNSSIMHIEGRVEAYVELDNAIVKALKMETIAFLRAISK